MKTNGKSSGKINGNTHAAFIAAVVGGMLLAAGAANAQVRIYPDAATCNDLTGGPLVQCQNQVYRQQLESGVSDMTVDPAEVPSSHIEGNEAMLPDFVPGAEGTEPPAAFAPAEPAVIFSLEGPEGTRVFVPTE